MSDEKETHGQAAIEKIRAHGKALKATWAAATDEERLAMVMDGGVLEEMIEEGLASPNEALRQACEALRISQAHTIYRALIDSPMMRRGREDFKQFWDTYADAAREVLADVGSRLTDENSYQWRDMAFQILKARTGQQYDTWVSLLISLTLEEMLAVAESGAPEEREKRLAYLLKNETMSYETLRRMEKAIGQPIPPDTPKSATDQPARRPKPQPITDTNGLVKIPGDRITQSAMVALTPGAMRRADEITEHLDGLSAQGLTQADQLRSAYVFGYKDGTSGAIGYFEDPGDAHWALIQKNGELAIRLQCALWAHAYAETGGEPEPGKFVTLNIADLCDTLGYERHNRAHQKKNKQAVKEGLRALTRQELLVIARLPSGKAARLTGPLWTRGIEADTAESYDDLFGSNRVGDPSAWEPATFAYAPGPFFADKGWRQYNHSFALVGQNLLKLKGAHDRWAVMLGGYLASLSRMNSYQTSKLKVRTLLDKSGLQRRFGRRSGEMREHFERALERLKVVAVIGDWRYDQTGLSTDAVDSLDENALDLLHAESTDDFRDWRVVIHWPAALTERGQAIGDKHEQHKKQAIAKAKKRRKRTATD